MCLLLVAHRVVPGSPVVVAANRDERVDRPATALTVLQRSPPAILGGRDLQAGGTWLAVNERGVVAGLTNRPSPAGPVPGRRSRGELPLLLADELSAEAAVEAFSARVEPSSYNPAWLLVGDRRSLFYLELDRVSGIPMGVASAGCSRTREPPARGAVGQDRSRPRAARRSLDAARGPARRASRLRALRPRARAGTGSGSSIRRRGGVGSPAGMRPRGNLCDPLVDDRARARRGEADPCPRRKRAALLDAVCRRDRPVAYGPVMTAAPAGRRPAQPRPG